MKTILEFLIPLLPYCFRDMAVRPNGRTTPPCPIHGSFRPNYFNDIKYAKRSATC